MTTFTIKIDSAVHHHLIYIYIYMVLLDIKVFYVEERWIATPTFKEIGMGTTTLAMHKYGWPPPPLKR